MIIYILESRINLSWQYKTFKEKMKIEIQLTKWNLSKNVAFLKN